MNSTPDPALVAAAPATEARARDGKYSLLVLGIVFNVLGQLLTKQAAVAGAGAGHAHKSLLSLWFVAGTGSLGVSMLVWVLLLRKMPLNLAHPITTASCLVLVACASRGLWNEPMPLTRIVGIGVIAMGVLLVARGMK